MNNRVIIYGVFVNFAKRLYKPLSPLSNFIFVKFTVGTVFLFVIFFQILDSCFPIVYRGIVKFYINDVCISWTREACNL